MRIDVWHRVTPESESEDAEDECASHQHAHSEGARQKRD
jgi:hypothetical protein